MVSLTTFSILNTKSFFTLRFHQSKIKLQKSLNPSQQHGLHFSRCRGHDRQTDMSIKSDWKSEDKSGPICHPRSLQVAWGGGKDSERNFAVDFYWQKKILISSNCEGYHYEYSRDVLQFLLKACCHIPFELKHSSINFIFYNGLSRHYNAG